MLASATVHRGEEPPISGTRGSATFFFSHCPLSCVFCQNYPISQLGHGKVVSVEDVATRMIALERRRAHNINVVTGTHYATQIVEAVSIARDSGMRLPVVWNTSGYETPETVDLLDGTVDVYLTDIKYASDDVASVLSDASSYWEISTGAAKRMFEQVGPLVVDRQGIAVRGVIVRHLVLPGGLAGTQRVMEFIADELGPEVPVSVMGQYFPAHRALEIDQLDRALLPEEYEEAKRIVVESGIERGWFQD